MTSKGIISSPSEALRVTPFGAGGDWAQDARIDPLTGDFIPGIQGWVTSANRPYTPGLSGTAYFSFDTNDEIDYVEVLFLSSVPNRTVSSFVTIGRNQSFALLETPFLINIKFTNVSYSFYPASVKLIVGTSSSFVDGYNFEIGDKMRFRIDTALPQSIIKGSDGTINVTVSSTSNIDIYFYLELDILEDLLHYKDYSLVSGVIRVENLAVGGNTLLLTNIIKASDISFKSGYFDNSLQPICVSSHLAIESITGIYRENSTLKLVYRMPNLDTSALTSDLPATIGVFIGLDFSN